MQPAKVSVDMARLPGNYGLASYHQEEDRERTLAQARLACNNPYSIGAGPNGGVMLHAVGQSAPTEMFLKTDREGRSFLGPKGPAGIPQDRLVVSYDNGILETVWIEKRARDVYGTMLFIPCT
ncbi:hypothetical protein CSC94_22410 [Zhengella mangrovi]|uniref:Uncharacterized protein n=2 Tax=Zhengella mangrovi TaxID=1982044 RepID=A0A2G1QH99_9HYPH|nr:hypothetical protein CSC94_22410 [Zhengella mangrovi]